MSEQLVVFSEDWHFHCVATTFHLTRKGSEKATARKEARAGCHHAFKVGASAMQATWDMKTEWNLQFCGCTLHYRTPLAAMTSSPPPPDLYCSNKANTNSIRLKTGNNQKGSRLVHYTDIVKNLKSSWVRAGKSAMADATEKTARPLHRPFIHKPQRCARKIFFTYVVSLS